MPTDPRRTSPKTEIRSDAAVKQIGIRVPTDLSDQLKAIARRERNGLSSVVRRLLVAALACERGDA